SAPSTGHCAGDLEWPGIAWGQRPRKDVSSIMARTTRKSATKRSGGITLFGVLVGLILGLAAAVAVALFVTQVPMPFADKASRDPSKVLLPDVRDAPDPNLGLFGSAGTAPRGPTDTRIQPPAPGTPSAPAE